MKTQIRIALVLAAGLYLAWAGGLWFLPGRTYSLLTADPYSPGLSALFGASLVAMAVLFVITVRHPLRPLVHASSSALLLIGLTAAYQMFLTHGMAQGLATVVSLILNFAIGLFLVMAVSSAIEADGARRRRPRAARRAMTPRRV